MRVDTSQELDSGDATLEIPWEDPSGPEVCYVDLKVHPEAIDRLAECRRHPSLAELLRHINAPESIFRTAKCDVWETTELAEDERLDFGSAYKVGSYVDLLFDKEEMKSDLHAHRQLAERVQEAVKGLRVQAQLELVVRRCLFHPEERWGYYLTIFAHAYGAVPAEAQGQWKLAMAGLGDVLVEIDLGYRGEGRSLLR